MIPSSGNLNNRTEYALRTMDTSLVFNHRNGFLNSPEDFTVILKIAQVKSLKCATINSEGTTIDRFHLFFFFSNSA